MPKKFAGQNSKAVAAKERKAIAKQEKDEKLRQEQERKEAAEWAVGARKTKEDEERKREERQRRKAEAAALLAKEEQELSKSKGPRSNSTSSTSSSNVTKKKVVPTLSPFTPTSKLVTSSDPLAMAPSKSQSILIQDHPDSYSASGLDHALELLDLTVNENTKGTELDRHPERRAKAAWLAFKERELPNFKKENPGLKLSQMNERLWKIWQKSPENPFNQGAIAYNATMEMEQEAAQKQKDEKLQFMRTR